MSGSLLDESKYLGNLKYKVWESMQAVAPYSKSLFNVQKDTDKNSLKFNL